jgi:arylsulfatase A-like enzyme
MVSRRELLAGGLAASSPAAPVKRKPNILIILMDDLGCRDLGCLGAGDLQTPHIDRLAASGVQFTNWYSNAPVCAPARAALLTGRYPIRAGMPVNGRELPPSEKTIPTLLKNAGYTSALTGKWHLGSSPDTVPNAHGFDYFYGFLDGCVDYYSHRFYWGEPQRVNFHDLWRNREEVFEDGRYLTERIAQEAAQFVSARRSKPFFLYCAFSAVHYPMHAPRKYLERFPDLDRERQIYAAMLAAADDGIGEILAALERTGQRESTLIIFAGDNGATTEARAGLNQKPATAGRNGPFRGYKFSVFDGGMHVPGIMSWPGVIPAGQRVEEVVMTADVLPTVCGVAGVGIPTDRTIDGRDILPVARASTKTPHTAIFWANGGQLAVRRGRWKLVINGIVYDGSEEGYKSLTGDDALFLSDLEADPGERRNMRRRHPELVDELASQVHHWRETVGSP